MCFIGYTSALTYDLLLPQTNRATRYVSRNLDNCCTTVRTTSATNSQIEVMEVEHFGRPTCNKLCASSHDASAVISVVNKLDRRRVLLTTRLT